MGLALGKRKKLDEEEIPPGVAKVLGATPDGKVVAADVTTGKVKEATPVEPGERCGGQTTLRNGDVLFCTAEAQYYMVHGCHLVPIVVQKMPSCAKLPLPVKRIEDARKERKERFHTAYGCGCFCPGCIRGGSCLRPRCPRCRGFRCYAM